MAGTFSLSEPTIDPPETSRIRAMSLRSSSAHFGGLGGWHCFAGWKSVGDPLSSDLPYRSWCLGSRAADACRRGSLLRVIRASHDPMARGATRPTANGGRHTKVAVHPPHTMAVACYTLLWGSDPSCTGRPTPWDPPSVCTMCRPHSPPSPLLHCFGQ
jgi:hypothetical protein